MGASHTMQGARLSYVARRFTRDWSRQIVIPKDGQNIREWVTEKGGYFIYIPSGNAYIMTNRMAQEKGYLEDPKILNLDSVTDNTTPAGMYKYARTDKARDKAYRLMEEELIKYCTRLTGPLKPPPLIEEGELEKEAA